MTCGFECHQIGGPWIAENPDCPIHGREAQSKAAAHENDKDAIHSILMDTWHRSMSADDALDEIFNIIGDLYER